MSYNIMDELNRLLELHPNDEELKDARNFLASLDIYDGELVSEALSLAEEAIKRLTVDKAI